MFERLQNLDRDVTLAINSLNTPLSDGFWQFMSDTKVWIPFYLALIVWLVVKAGPRKTAVIVVTIAITILLCDQLSNLVKDFAGRLRPCYDDWCVDRGLHILEPRTGLFGFFSAHAANAFGLAVCVTACVRRDFRLRHKHAGLPVVMFAWAFFVAFSRVFVGKHFLGDILAGSAVGLIIGYLTARLARQIMYSLGIS